MSSVHAPAVGGFYSYMLRCGMLLFIHAPLWDALRLVLSILAVILLSMRLCGQFCQYLLGFYFQFHLEKISEGFKNIFLHTFVF